MFPGREERKMWQKILAISLVLVIVLSFVACDREPSAQEIVDSVIEAGDELKTFGFDIDINIGMDVEAESDRSEITSIMDLGGLLDLENRQMEMDLNLDLSIIREGIIEQEMNIGIEMAMYLIDNMAYMMMEDKEIGQTWMKLELPAEAWQEISGQMIEPFNMTRLQTELFEVTQVDVIGSEMIGGIDCYVLQLNLDIDWLWQKIIQWSEEMEEEIPPDFDKESLQDILQDVSIKQWVAKDTHFITRLKIDIDMEVTPEDMGITDEEGFMAMDMTIDLIIYDHNQPVSIILPLEAEEAQDMMDWQSSIYEGEISPEIRPDNLPIPIKPPVIITITSTLPQ